MIPDYLEAEEEEARDPLVVIAIAGAVVAALLGTSVGIAAHHLTAASRPPAPVVRLSYPPTGTGSR